MVSDSDAGSEAKKWDGFVPQDKDISKTIN